MSLLGRLICRSRLERSQDGSAIAGRILPNGFDEGCFCRKLLGRREAKPRGDRDVLELVADCFNSLLASANPKDANCGILEVGPVAAVGTLCDSSRVTWEFVEYLRVAFGGTVNFPPSQQVRRVGLRLGCIARNSEQTGRVGLASNGLGAVTEGVIQHPALEGRQIGCGRIAVLLHNPGRFEQAGGCASVVDRQAGFHNGQTVEKGLRLGIATQDSPGVVPGERVDSLGAPLGKEMDRRYATVFGVAEPNRQKDGSCYPVSLIQTQPLLAPAARGTSEETLMDRVGIKQAQFANQGESTEVAIL